MDVPQSQRYHNQKISQALQIPHYTKHQTWCILFSMLQTILNTLPYIQIALSVIVITLVLLQPTDADAGGSFGGGANSTWHTRRGGEKLIYLGTIVFGILFVISVFADLFV